MASDTNINADQSKPSYADRLKTNVKYDQRLKRNILEINIEKKDEETELILDQNVIARLMNSLKMNVEKEMEGYQVKMTKGGAVIQVWCKIGVDLDKFCMDEKIKVGNGVYTGSIHPAGRRDVTVTVSGLNWNTPDSLVMEYIRKFGGELVTEEVIYSKHGGEGPLAGMKNGDRKYQAIFNGTKMGTFHFIDGERVKIYYRGNTKTCGYCQSTADTCAGAGLAKECKNKGGKKVDLADHMRTVWKKIGFSPTSFTLPEALDTETEYDVTVKEAPSFNYSAGKKSDLSDVDLKKVTGVEVRNFPDTLQDEEVRSFIEEKLGKQISKMSYERKFKQLNVKVEPGNGMAGSKIQQFANEINFLVSKKKFFGNPLYCRLLKNLTPEKEKPKDQNSQTNKTCKSPILSLGSVSAKRVHAQVGSPVSPEGTPFVKKSNLL